LKKWKDLLVDCCIIRVFGTKIVVIIHSGESYEIVKVVQLWEISGAVDESG